MRANDEIFEPARMEGINFVPYSAPVSFIRNKEGLVSAIEVENHLPINNDPNNLKYKGSGYKY